MKQSSQILEVGIEQKLPMGQNLLFGFQHLLALTGIFLFPVLIGQALHLPSGTIGYIVQACFITTGLVTVLQSGALLKLPVVQGPTAVFFIAVLSTAGKMGLGTAFGSMAVAGIIFMLLSIPIRRFGLMGILIKFISPPIVYGSLLVVIGGQLASIGLTNWFGVASTPGYPGFNFFASLVTVLAVILFMIFGGNTIVRRAALIFGIIVGTIFFSIFQPIDWSSMQQASWFQLPQIFPFGFSVSAPTVILMLLAFLQASAEAMGMYTLLSDWGNQKLTPIRVNRGLFGEFIGCTVGAIFGGLGTTSYPENIGIIRVSGIGSRFVTLTAGILAIILGLIPKVGTMIASIPSPILSSASTILFGIIAVSGIQMLSKVKWDELNLVVAATSIIIALGTAYLPQDVVNTMPPAIQSIVTEPMMVGVILLVTLNMIINMLIRPRLKA